MTAMMDLSKGFPIQALLSFGLLSGYTGAVGLFTYRPSVYVRQMETQMTMLTMGIFMLMTK